MKPTILLVFLFALPLAAASGGELHFTNGDRLTGNVLELEGETLRFRSKLAGEVSVAWTSVARLATAEPVHVTLRDGTQLAGRLRLDPADAVVDTVAAGRVTVSRDALAAIRSEQRHQARLAELERLRNPRFTDLWSGSADAGLAMARGNSDTLNWNLGLRAARTSARDRWSFYFSQLYAESRTDGEAEVTASAIRGGLRYDLNLTERLFAFGFTDFEADRFQNLDLRNVIGGGLGYQVVQAERTQLDLFAGASFNNEFFDDMTRRRSGEGVAGQELRLQWNERFSLTERLVFFPNLTDTGSYRIQFDTSAETRLSRWLSWQVTVSDRFLSNPAGDARQNDLLLTTGIRVSFGRGREFRARSRAAELLRR